jgi:hypothetical protein
MPEATDWNADSTNPALWRYAMEKLEAAVEVLATHPEEVRRRLFFAYDHLASVPALALPAGLRAQYHAIMGQLTEKTPPEPGLGRLTWNLNAMDKATGAKIAEQIVRLHSELEFVSSTLSLINGR